MEKVRCLWAGKDPQMIAYHDEEWGVPEYDSRALWEKLMLDGFQAGLSWSIILRKRDAFRKAFKNFDPKRETVIIGMPQLLEHDLTDEKTHWEEIEYLVGAAASDKINLVLSLHPKQDKVRYEYLEKKFNAVISPKPLRDVMALAKIYLSTYSGTTLWSAFRSVLYGPWGLVGSAIIVALGIYMFLERGFLHAMTVMAAGGLIFFVPLIVISMRNAAQAMGGAG